MNICAIVGRLVYEPEMKQTKNGTNYVSTRIAVERHDQNKTTDFFTVRTYGKTSEFIVKYFHKGDPIEVSGELQTESYTRQDGTKVDGVFILISKVGFVPQKAQAKPEYKVESAPAPVSGILLTADTDEIVGDLASSANDLPFQI